MTPLLDAHLHTVRSPGTSYPENWSYCTCSAGPADWKPLLQAERPGLRPFLGLHPEEITETAGEDLDRLEELLTRHPAAGVGECGLDRRFYRTVPRSRQEELLVRQIRTACRLDRPLCLHQVRAAGALAEVLERERPVVPCLLHGFREQPETARRYLRLGGYLSLGPGRHWENEDFRTMIRELPLNRILLESDWPYTRCEDYREVLEDLYSTAAGVLGIDRNELITIVRNNGTVFTN